MGAIAISLLVPLWRIRPSIPSQKAGGASCKCLCMCKMASCGTTRDRCLFRLSPTNREEIPLDELAQFLPIKAFTPVQLNLEKPKTVWVATVEVELSRLEGTRTIAIIMNASSFQKASELDYFITNVDYSIVTDEWIVSTYAQRNWVEVFYREAKGWLGLSEYQVRDYRTLLRHFTLVFCAYTFILWHTKTCGLILRWAQTPLNTFVDAYLGV